MYARERAQEVGHDEGDGHGQAAKHPFDGESRVHSVWKHGGHQSCKIKMSISYNATRSMCLEKKESLHKENNKYRHCLFAARFEPDVTGFAALVTAPIRPFTLYSGQQNQKALTASVTEIMLALLTPNRIDQTPMDTNVILHKKVFP